ncbi:MAG: hypothetical protein VYE73_07295 [Acidobacteriota bacterium]|nr:hypothetical protein [Acidobacteriota bacterium]
MTLQPANKYIGNMHASYQGAVSVRAGTSPAITCHEVMASPLNKGPNPRLAFKPRQGWGIPGYTINGSLRRFANNRSAVLVTVEPDSGDVTCEAFRTRGPQYESLFTSNFTV